MKRDLIVISLEPWDDVWRRNQHLVTGVMRERSGCRVLFVEPPSDMALTLSQRAVPQRGKGLRRGPSVAGAPTGELWLYQPTKWLPRRVDRSFDRRRCLGVVRLAGQLNFIDPVVWINDADGAHLLDSGWNCVYDITDDWLEADRPPAELTRIFAAEARLMADAAEVTVCSSELARTKGAHRDVTLITNGVEAELYAQHHTRPADLPAGSTAMYLGTLHSDRLDVELSVSTASSLRTDPHSAATLVFVGPNALSPSDTQRIVDAGGVILGSRPASTVPAYATNADVLVVPHVVNTFTDSLNPIKLYEYLATGRPVVSTAVAGFRDTQWSTIRISARDRFASDVVAAIGTEIRPVTAPEWLPTWRRQAELMTGVIDRASMRSGTR